MSKDLTTPHIDRKKILNNNEAVKEIYDNIGFHGVLFEGRYRFTKNQISQFFEVDARTIERLLVQFNDELSENGYEVFTGTRLKDLREAFLRGTDRPDVSDIGVGDIPHGLDNEIISSRALSVGTFTFKAFLNIGMPLTESERARELRSAIFECKV
jgi:hypothetical protein